MCIIDFDILMCFSNIKGWGSVPTLRRSFVYPHRCALAGGQFWHPQHGAICLKTIYLQRC